MKNNRILFILSAGIVAMLTFGIFRIWQNSSPTKCKMLLTQDKRFYETLADACDQSLKILTNHSEILNVQGNDLCLPETIRNLRADSVLLQTGTASIVFGSGRLVCVVSWRQSEEDPSLQQLFVIPDGNPKLVFQRKR